MVLLTDFLQIYFNFNLNVGENRRWLVGNKQHAKGENL